MMMTCLLLAACATNSSKQSFEYQKGKSSFENGYYKDAFHQLLPVAAQGKPEAQYAVGYMYYYGYGVPEDTESGTFWMTKAADQNYPPAIRALQIIHHPTPDAESFVPARQDSAVEQRRDALLQNMREQRESYIIKPQKMSALEPEPNPEEPVVKMASSVEEKQEVTNPEPPRKYALQLYGSYHLDAVKDLQSQLRLKNTGHIYQTTHDGKGWYVLTFGNFITAHEASATQKNLPTELKNMHPWVRNVDELKLA
jgi:septal ring-binding cell division protein DamX